MKLQLQRTVIVTVIFRKMNMCVAHIETFFSALQYLWCTYRIFNVNSYINVLGGHETGFPYSQQKLSTHLFQMQLKWQMTVFCITFVSSHKSAVHYFRLPVSQNKPVHRCVLKVQGTDQIGLAIWSQILLPVRHIFSYSETVNRPCSFFVFFYFWVGTWMGQG